MSGSFTATAERHDYFGQNENGQDNVFISKEQKEFAQDLLYECTEKIDILWHDMFDKIQDETGLSSPEVYLLIQRIQYPAPRSQKRRKK